MKLWACFLFLFFWHVAEASPPPRWNMAVSVVERHEFYRAGENMIKPAGAWQTLFAIQFVDRALRRFKDCVYFRVPGAEPGVLKVKVVSMRESCDKFMFQAGDIEVREITAMHFTDGPGKVSLHLSRKGFRPDRWDIQLRNSFQRPSPRQQLSSAEFKGPKFVFLTGARDLQAEVLKADAKCHDVDDSCLELKPSNCHACPEGWYEVPNGCPQGPKFCGRHNCGEKNMPACRRGMQWQRKDKSYDCRTDTSFAYCAPGLSVQCEGALAYCR
jgi:hypothetical protein